MPDVSDILTPFESGAETPLAPSALPFSGQPEWTPLDFPVSRKITPTHIKYVEETVPLMMQRSAEYMQRKRPLIEMLIGLRENRLSLGNWKPNCWTPQLAAFEEYVTSYRQTLRRRTDESGPEWRSDFTVAVQPIIDSYREAFIQAIFTQDDYFKVSPGPRNATGSVEDTQYSTASKIQSKVISTCDDLLIRSNLDLTVSDSSTVGTGVVKAAWHEETQTQAGLNQWGELEFRPQVIRHGTLMNPLDLTRVLVDPDATSDDCQRWRFIGDRTNVDWDVAKSRFATKDNPGPYNLGYKEFIQKWPDSGDEFYSRGDGFVKDDPDRDTLTKAQGQIQAWELHCTLRFPGERTPTECVVTYLTDLHTDNPSGGILVRLQLQPATRIGLRPYCVYQFNRQAGPLGIGAIEANLDIIWMLSHAVNLFIDACRFVAIPLVKAHHSSSLAQDASKVPGGTVLWPGKILTWESDPNDVAPFWFQADLAAPLQMINYLDSQLDRRTSVSNVSRGAPAPKRQTATEVASLVQQAAQPLAAKLALFRETILNPFAKLAVGYLQSYIFEDQHIFIQGPDGKPVPTILTVEEIRTGEYIAKAVVNLPDQMKISKAQTIMQIIPILQQVSQTLLILENKNIKFSGLIEALLKLLDIQEVANVIETVDEMTKQAILMTMMGPQQPPPQQQEAPPPDQQMPPQGEQLGPTGGPDDTNQLMQMLQMAAENQGPVPPGQQMAAA